MVNLVEKVLCVEILEKISRAQRFLRLEPDMARCQGPEVLDIFVAALDGTVDSLTPVTERLSEAAPLDRWECLAITRRLSETFDSLCDLHRQLQFIHGAWVRPETHVFIRDVLEFIPSERRPDAVSVILSNSYSFLETDLSFYLQSVLHSRNVRLAFEERTPTVFLPKIECDNPLNWAILVHECGHTDRDGVSQARQVIPDSAEESIKHVLRKWAEEIYCDIFATQILGPAYLASFVTFALAFAGAGGVEMVTMTHPADIVRICIVHEFLENKNVKVALGEPWSDYADIASFYYNLLEERASLDRKYMHTVARQPGLPWVLPDFVDAISEQADELITLSRQVAPGEFSRVEHLVAERLSRGIPIGSYPNPERVKQAIESLEERNLNGSKFDELKEASQESRTLIWEIVNAGWVHKVRSGYPSAFALFFSAGDASVQSRMLTWGKELEVADKLLLKSIESSEIHRLLEER